MKQSITLSQGVKDPNQMHELIIDFGDFDSKFSFGNTLSLKGEAWIVVEEHIIEDNE